MAPLIGIVDDDQGVRTSTSSLVRSAGYRTALFASADTFLNSNTLSDMSCVIVDLEMPLLNGSEIPGLLAGMNVTLPIILMSANEDEVLVKSLRNRVFAFIRKPFRGEALLDMIRLALKPSGR